MKNLERYFSGSEPFVENYMKLREVSAGAASSTSSPRSNQCDRSWRGNFYGKNGMRGPQHNWFPYRRGSQQGSSSDETEALDPKLESQLYANSPNQGKGFERLGLITEPIEISPRMSLAFGANRYRNGTYVAVVFIKRTNHGRLYFDFSSKNLRSVVPYLRQHAYLVSYPTAKEFFEPCPPDFDRYYHDPRPLKLLDGTLL